MERIKFYSSSDFAAGHHLSQVERLIIGFELHNERTINEILELYNCTQYIENKVFFTTWTEEYKERLQASCKEIKSYIARCFKEINSFNIDEYSKALEWNFKEDFLTLFCQYKLTERIDEDRFSSLLENNYFSIMQICHHKPLVEYYSSVVKKLLLSNSSNMELLFDKYVVDYRLANNKQIYLPKILTKDDVHILISDYIDSVEANTSYLQLIINNHNTGEFSVTDEHRWKAKKRKDTLQKELFGNNSGLELVTKVALEKDVPELVVHKIEGTEISIKFDRTYLENELDYPTILNNFIWLFGFIDCNGRMTVISKTAYRTSILDSLGIRAKKDYPDNIAFQTSEMLMDTVMTMYYSFLKKQNIRLELVIEWFFKDYLREEFKLLDYSFLSPSEEASYREKCRDILPGIEYVLQQFKSFVEYREINHDMLELSTSGLLFGQVPSLIENKYVYAKSDLNTAFHYLFSDQTGLGYLGNPEKNSSTFYELLKKHNINIGEFQSYHKSEIDYLIEKGYIKVDNKGEIKWGNQKRVRVLNELYYSGVISFYRMPSIIQTEIKIMYQEGLVNFESSLFSKSEQDLLDYYLNNTKFQNGPQLRNKYAHGRLGSDNENINYKNYLVILRLFIAIVIKVNEDFCLCEIVNNGT